MSNDLALAEFEAERDRLARLTRMGIGMPVAGCLYWLVVGVLLRVFPPGTALVFAFMLTGMVFPLGFLLTRLFGGDLFAKSASLTPLGIILAAIQLFYWPIIVVVFQNAREWTPFVLAVLFGSHFLPYLWFYRSRGYAFLALSTCLVLSGAAVVTRSPLFHQVPWIAAGCYAIAVIILMGEIRRLSPARN